MKKAIPIIILSCIGLLGWTGLRVYKAIVFKIECEGHMKRAADANTVELARQEMEIVVNYLEKNGMTNGYTSILYRTPDEDVGFFYQNMKASLTELKNLRADATSLEKSNVLIKLRETLLDENKGNATVTVPPGISVFPYNAAYAISGVILGILTIIGLLSVIFVFTEDSY